MRIGSDARDIAAITNIFSHESHDSRNGEYPYAVIVHEDLKITVGDAGFLASLEDWSETVAYVLAAQETFGELSEDRLDILKLMRGYYLKHIFCPIVRFV